MHPSEFLQGLDELFRFQKYLTCHMELANHQKYEFFIIYRSVNYSITFNKLSTYLIWLKVIYITNDRNYTPQHY